jgi:glycosyltransferase involved in cell wall biosynthesis
VLRGNSEPHHRLYEANRLRQVQDGAPAERTENIPNGINLPRLAAVARQPPGRIPRTVCLIGRVVPIKDIKTFIRAMRTVANRLPDVQAWIAGPEDEDPAYARDCRTLATGLGLGHRQIPGLPENRRTAAEGRPAGAQLHQRKRCRW